MPEEEKVEQKTDDKKEIQEEKKVETEVIDYEKIAKSKGWRPKGEYSGDGWVDAEEFVKREPLFERIKRYGSEVNELKKVISDMTSHFKKAQDVAVQKAIADLKTQRKEAIETGDVTKVEQIDEQIEQQKQIKAEAPTQVEIKPEISEWVSKNKWFDEKPRLQKFAIAFNKSYAADNPDMSLSELLDETTRAVKARFPDEFKDNTTRRESASPVETPTTEARGVKKGYGRDRLNEAQKRVYDQVKRYGIMPPEEYVKQLEEMGELA